jgi:hypothetical protein
MSHRRSRLNKIFMPPWGQYAHSDERYGLARLEHVLLDGFYLFGTRRISVAAEPSTQTVSVR